MRGQKCRLPLSPPAFERVRSGRGGPGTKGVEAASWAAEKRVAGCRWAGGSCMARGASRSWRSLRSLQRCARRAARRPGGGALGHGEPACRGARGACLEVARASSGAQHRDVPVAAAEAASTWLSRRQPPHRAPHNTRALGGAALAGQGPVNDTARRSSAPSCGTDGRWLLSCARERSHHCFTRHLCTQTAQTAALRPWEARALGRRGRR